ncbi:MAG: tyrosine-type recombinase/integrase [Armatimonadota bacterium]
MQATKQRIVRDSIVLFLNERRFRNLAPDTVTKYEQMLNRVLEPILDKSCLDVTTEEVRECVYALEGLSPHTTNGYIRSIKCWVNYCLEEEIEINVNPKRIKKLKTPKPLPPHLTEEEMVALLGIPDRRTPYGCRNHCLIALLLDTGLRITAALNIRLSDIRNDRILVMDKGRREREVGISGNMQPILANWVGVRHVYLGEAFPTDTEYLFPGRLSQQLTRRHAESLVSQYAVAAGIGRRVYPHMLRSTFATEATRSGIGMEHLRKTMGWTSLEMVKVYVEAFDSDAQAASRKHSPMGRLEMGKRRAR